MAGSAGRARLRTAEADREHAIDVLKAAFVQGRLTKDELDARLGRTLVSRTYADLADLTDDIPASVLQASKPTQADRPRPRLAANKVITSGALALCAPAVLGAALCTGNGTLQRVFLLLVVMYFGVLSLVGFNQLLSWSERGSSGD